MNVMRDVMECDMYVAIGFFELSACYVLCL